MHGLFLFRAASFDGQLVALHDVGKEGHVLLFLFDRFIQDGPPARLDHGEQMVEKYIIMMQITIK